MEQQIRLIQHREGFVDVFGPDGLVAVETDSVIRV